MDRTTSSVVLALLPTKISSVFELFLHFFVFAQKTFLQFLTISFVGLVLRHADEISLRTYFLTGPKLALIYAHQRPTKVLLIFQSKKLWYKKSLQNCIFSKIFCKAAGYRAG